MRRPAWLNVSVRTRTVAISADKALLIDLAEARYMTLTAIAG